MKQKINIQFRNGLSFEDFQKDVFEPFGLTEKYFFEQSEKPDVVIFGPYGDDIPPKGNYTIVGYFCENILPDLSICDYAFGIPLESEIKNSRYKRIQWHGFNPEVLVKNYSDNEIDQILNTKTRFCNFLYSNPIHYREEFFKQLSKYKKIDAPGLSMNNMHHIDSTKDSIWEAKRHFLLPYKFTIAFENDVYPGYQTEKLYDAMKCDSLPIYCGDPNISDVFNTRSFINVPEYVKPNAGFFIKSLEKIAQQDFTDYRPAYYNRLRDRIKRNLKSRGRKLKMKLLFNNLNSAPFIEKIIEIDRNQDLYIEYLKQPWFNDNIIPQYSSSVNRWIEIFNKHKSE
ncbi:glycosyltransferase family 10 domain-containing protein [Pedobacter sp. Leaf176]|uniref:glycosyltransferase family 10 domain-containing protein n=1 Tax=Pedobacter sp. Leaf176 TaxID=1736286 RepID=UPI0006FD6ABA|nr:glycosyltransferase family 10 [Pedobacter sp. Leaf176]KQR72693.1 hypothetical protein ASF92_05310 [Pedobacter sp. Leaf176]